VNKKTRQLLVALLQFETEEELEKKHSSKNFKKLLRVYRRMLDEYSQRRTLECAHIESEDED